MVTALVGFPFDDELEHGNIMRKDSAKQPEDGRWLNGNRFILGKAAIEGSPIPVDNVPLR